MPCNFIFSLPLNCSTYYIILTGNLSQTIYILSNPILYTHLPINIQSLCLFVLNYVWSSFVLWLLNTISNVNVLAIYRSLLCFGFECRVFDKQNGWTHISYDARAVDREREQPRTDDDGVER